MRGREEMRSERVNIKKRKRGGDRVGEGEGGGGRICMYVMPKDCILEIENC